MRGNGARRGLMKTRRAARDGLAGPPVGVNEIRHPPIAAFRGLKRHAARRFREAATEPRIRTPIQME